MKRKQCTRNVAFVPVRSASMALGVASGMCNEGHRAVAVALNGQAAVLVVCQPSEVKS